MDAIPTEERLLDVEKRLALHKGMWIVVCAVLMVSIGALFTIVSTNNSHNQQAISEIKTNTEKSADANIDVKLSLTAYMAANTEKINQLADRVDDIEDELHEWRLMIDIIHAQQPLTSAFNTKLSQLEADWYLEFLRDDRVHRMIITKGFLFDGASIPRFCWTVLGLAPHGVMDGPALPHDAGYELRGVFTDAGADCRPGPAALTGGATATLQVELSDGWSSGTPAMTKKELDELLFKLCEWFKVGVGVHFARPRLVWAAVRAFGLPAWRSDDRVRKAGLRSIAA